VNLVFPKSRRLVYSTTKVKKTLVSGYFVKICVGWCAVLMMIAKHEHDQKVCHRWSSCLHCRQPRLQVWQQQWVGASQGPNPLPLFLQPMGCHRSTTTLYLASRGISLLRVSPASPILFRSCLIELRKAPPYHPADKGAGVRSTVYLGLRFHQGNRGCRRAGMSIKPYSWLG
jgi:hypothetical protein